MSRPSTPPHLNDDGSTTIKVKRCCNGCGRELGDATRHELDCATAGNTLPDVRDECGCVDVDPGLDLDAIEAQLADPLGPNLHDLSLEVPVLVQEVRRLREVRAFYKTRANTHWQLRKQKQKQLDRALAARDAWKDTADTTIRLLGETEAERDEAREAIARVTALTYASDDGTDFEHDDDCDGQACCPACWATDIRRALVVPT